MSLLENDTGTGFGLKGQSRKRTGVVGTSDTGQGVIGQSGITVDTDPRINQMKFGVLGACDDSMGVAGLSVKSVGVAGISVRGSAVSGISVESEGVVGTSAQQEGVVGVAAARSQTGVRGVGGIDGDGVAGLSAGGNGVFGFSTTVGDRGGTGVLGIANGKGLGVSGYSPQGPVGTLGVSDGGTGVFGQSTGGGPGVEGRSAKGAGVVGRSDASSPGVEGHSAGSVGVLGASSNQFGGVGVHGKGGVEGVVGEGTVYGVEGISRLGVGVRGKGHSGGVVGDGGMVGVIGKGDLLGVGGEANPSSILGGVYGSSTSGTAVLGKTDSGRSVWGMSINGTGVEGWSVHPKNIGGIAWAGYFRGAVNVTGPVYKSGGGFRIDHPTDPANQYLSHSFVESPDMKNVYDGIATLGRGGEGLVELPAWFEALNRDFRYQLTAIGRATPNLHISSEIRRRRFRIAGGTPGLRVCWQVTGIRRDAWADQNRIPIEEKKPRAERGTYRHPEALGKSDDLSVEWARDPKLRLSLKRERKPNEALVDTFRRLINEAFKTLSAGRTTAAPRRKKQASRKRSSAQ